MAEKKSPVISFKDFSFQYRAQKKPTLTGINLDINPGEKVLIAGPSGSGKSTLAGCINGLNPFSNPGECKGTLTVDGVDAPHSSIFELSAHVGTDLQDPDYESAIALVHSRFSTNTNPSWERAHPNRFMVLNGEINSIRGNADKMLAREETMESGALKEELHKILPVVDTRGSDSSMLDNTLEFMVMSGMELQLAMMITIPEP